MMRIFTTLSRHLSSIILASLLVMLVLLGASCKSALTAPPDTSATDPANPPVLTAPSDGQPSDDRTVGDVGSDPVRSFSTGVLLFNGAGVSTSDWESTEQMIRNEGWSYQLVNSAQMNAMSVDQLAEFGVIVVPGGSGGTITANLTEDTRLRIRQAVRERGVGYVGFCAGAWVAVGPEAETNQVAGYGLAIAKGAVLDEFLPGGQAPTAAMVDVTFSDSVQRSLVWWGGPSTPAWAQGIVAKYDDGQPAISQTWAGKGYVVISGPHPEAPEGWRATAGPDVDGLDFDIAVEMIDAAMNQVPMPAF